MGDSRLCAPEPRYLYARHPSAIHSGPPRTAERATAPGQFPQSFSLQGRSHPHSHPRQHAAPPPTLLLLQPFLQLAPHSNVPAYSSPLAAPYPTVIVSPHYQSPTTERDPRRPAVKKPFTKPPAVLQELDGNNGALQGVHSSAPPMTSSGVSKMGSKREEGPMFPRSQRPSIVSQHSNSVPSTPLQLARQYESRSRSPSPNGGLGSHSPRSVSSEANGPMPSLKKFVRQTGCRFETNFANGRRRMPYVSSDILENPKEEPKKALDPQEEDKLSGDMRELYDRLLPTEESTNRRIALVKKLENILRTEWPGAEFKVHVFGSSGNLLCTSESDVDVCIQTPMKRLEEMHMLAEVLDKHGMEQVVCVPGAKVRIVKIWDPILKLACDMNVNNTLALENTRLIKMYVQIDERVRPLAMIIKHWTKQRILNDAAIGGTLSSYTWICMILNFLQTRDPPILPTLHKLPYREIDAQTGAPSTSNFANDLEKVKGFGADNTQSLGELLLQFFRHYGHGVDYEKQVVSVREGRLVLRSEKKWDLASLTKEARHRLCVEEPFNVERNLGNSADDFAWRGIHLEIRRAFDLLADGGQLAKACEQYEFPPEEKTVFKKPTASVKTTITQTAPSMRSGRGGANHRGGRGNFHQKHNHAYQPRRASSSASFSNNNRPSLPLNSPPIGAAMPGQDYFPRELNNQLADQLYQQYQLLEMQSNSLRAQLAAQQRAQQQHQHQVQAAQLHAQAVAQAQAQAHHRGQNSANGSPQKSPYVNGRSSPRPGEMGLPPTSLPQGFLYHYPGFFDPNQGGAPVSQDGPRTNPSSPSLTNSVPGLRRGVHRSSNASETGSIRSQSQPPRGLGQPNLTPGYPPMPYFDPASFAGYPIARSTQDVQSTHAAEAAPFSPLASTPEMDVPPEQETPKEYVGYYVAEPPQVRAQLQDYVVGPIPSYTELAQRRRRVSPEITHPLLNTALRRVSRSPSPLGGHMRSYSTGVTPPAPKPQARKDSTHPSDDSGPVIVNGSYPTPLRESRNRSGTVDALPVDMGNHSALGIFVSHADQYPRQQFTFEEIQRQRAPEAVGSSTVNGSASSTSPTDANSLSRVSSGGKQPFPPLPDAWMTYDSRNGDKTSESSDVSPTRTLPPQWRQAYTNGLSLSALETLNISRAPPQEIKSATLPLLSPVFETRTPSPTPNRQSDNNKMANGTKSGKENQQQRRASHTSHTPSHGPVAKENGRQNQPKANAQNEKSGKANGGQNHSSGNWQKNSNRKKKKNGAARQGNEAKKAGEPLPTNAAERKGG
ncbi:hypothetical protein P154DRAFT_138325 [Amniculicola lignicola CBS 123094]|uniref:polynucleotide adenylyltransferase n=1 Tax=Amniculicola lignicola CBS 123094 TaxID=1392246 RepID=A0A6A5WNC7_9PLEO|nr:hypothetical protein P154DRAFT_138325 [Amniculicola lignicola CBS 123094]